MKDPKKLHLFYFTWHFVTVCKCTTGQFCGHGTKIPIFSDMQSKVCLHSRMKIAIPALWHSLITEFLVLPSVFLFYLTSFFLELFEVFICLFCEFGFLVCLLGWVFCLFFFSSWLVGHFVGLLFVFKAIQRHSCNCVKPVVSSQDCQM